MTFIEIYNKHRDAGAAFVTAIAQVTCKSEITVRQWLYGTQKPDKLTKSVIADYLGSDIDTLFPETTNPQKHNDNESL